MIVVTITVKFRVFFTDLYKYHGSWTIPAPIPVPPGTTWRGLHINERGVVLDISLV